MNLCGPSPAESLEQLIDRLGQLNQLCRRLDEVRATFTPLRARGSSIPPREFSLNLAPATIDDGQRAEIVALLRQGAEGFLPRPGVIIPFSQRGIFRDTSP